MPQICVLLGFWFPLFCVCNSKTVHFLGYKLFTPMTCNCMTITCEFFITNFHTKKLLGQHQQPHNLIKFPSLECSTQMFPSLSNLKKGNVMMRVYMVQVVTIWYHVRDALYTTCLNQVVVSENHWINRSQK